MNVKKFNEFEVINEQVQPHYIMSRSQLTRLVFEIFENANNKDDVWNIINEQLKITEEERKIPLDVPKGAMM